MAAKFRDLRIGDTFDFSAGKYQTFYDTCVKTGTRTYQSVTTLLQYRVGSINCVVNPIGRDTSIDFVKAGKP